MKEEFTKAFSEVIREQIAQKNEVKLNGVGIFKLKHRKQSQQQHDDGRVVMLPPKNTIVFTPEKENSHG